MILAAWHVLPRFLSLVHLLVFLPPSEALDGVLLLQLNHVIVAIPDLMHFASHSFGRWVFSVQKKTEYHDCKQLIQA